MAITTGFGSGAAIRLGNPFDGGVVAILALLIPIYFVMVAFSMRPDVLTNWRAGLAKAVSSLFLAITGIALIGFYLQASAEMSRLMIIIGMGMTVLTLGFCRALIGRLSKHVFSAGAVSCLLISDGVVVSTPHNVSYFSAELLGLKGDLTDPITLDRLANCVSGYDRVIVACIESRRAVWSMALKGVHVPSDLLLPELNEIGALGCSHFEGIASVPYFCRIAPLPRRDRQANIGYHLGRAGSGGNLAAFGCGRDCD